MRWPNEIVSLPDMHAKRAVDARTIETDKDAIGYTCPLWIGCVAVKTGTVVALTLQFIELLFVFGHGQIGSLLTPDVFLFIRCYRPLLSHFAFYLPPG